MRYKNFYKLAGGNVRKLRFTPAHFRLVGLSFMETGMTVLEAHELVNRWNRKAKGKAIHWLEEQ